jgi:hypothetical protein
MLSEQIGGQKSLSWSCDVFFVFIKPTGEWRNWQPFKDVENPIEIII